MSNFDINIGTLLENFEAVGDFTITGGVGTNDATYVKEGASSLKLASTVGSTCSAVKTVNFDFSGVCNVHLWVYVESSELTSSVQIALSNDSGFSNYFTINAQFHPGWNKILIPRSLWGTVGSPTWASPIIRLRIRTTGQSGQSSVIYLDSMYYQSESRAKCIVSFDDNWDSVYSEGFAYMKKHGFKGVLFTVSSYIDDASRMTTAQVQECFDAGWDVCNHTETHTNLETGYTLQSEVETELANCRDFIISNGWNRRNSAYHVAYPQGGYDDKTLAAMASTGMITGRLTTNRLQAQEIDQAYLLTRQSHDYTASEATYKGWIDKAIESGGQLQLNYHKIVADDAGAATTEVEQSQFRDAMDYLNSQRTRIDAISFTEWYIGLTKLRRLV